MSSLQAQRITLHICGSVSLHRAAGMVKFVIASFISFILQTHTNLQLKKRVGMADVPLKTAKDIKAI